MARRRSLIAEYLRRASLARRTGESVGALDLARDFRAWARSQGRSGMDDSYPWITFEATRRLESLLTRRSRVFEYGTGGSTLFLATRVASVVSVENDPAWYGEARERLDRLGNVTVFLVPGEAATGPEDERFASRSQLFSHLTFRKYVCTIDQFPDESFDLLLIDGRARPSALFRGHRKVRVGGSIVLDDSERSGYAPALEAAATAGWPAFGRLGPKPYTPAFARTTIWTKTGPLGVDIP